jgi:hypothetical protein
VQLENPGVLKAMRSKRVCLKAWVHRLAPVFHGVGIEDEWSACGLARWERKPLFGGLQLTCQGPNTGFVTVQKGANEGTDAMLEAYRNWANALREIGKPLGTTETPRKTRELVKNLCRLVHELASLGPRRHGRS